MVEVYYIDVVLGDDGNIGKSPGAGNAWASFEKAAGTVVAGDLVWVKASASYTAEDASNDCICLIDTPGTMTEPIVWVGYYEFPGDGGIVTMDASSNVLANVVRTDMSGGDVYHVFEGFEMTGATSHGFNGNGGADRSTKVINCSINNNGGKGIWTERYTKIASSRIANNTDIGVRMSTASIITNSIIYNNANFGCAADGTLDLLNCILYGNSTRQLQSSNVLYTNNVVVDGDGVADGIYLTQSERSLIQNTIIYDCVNGITETTDTGKNASAFNNLFYSNTNDVVNFLPVADQPGSLIASSDPFVDAANRNYRLKLGSEAISRGIDAGQTLEFWDQYDRGINPPTIPVGTSKVDIGAQQRAMVNMRRRFGG